MAAVGHVRDDRAVAEEAALVALEGGAERFAHDLGAEAGAVDIEVEAALLAVIGDDVIEAFSVLGGCELRNRPFEQLDAVAHGFFAQVGDETAVIEVVGEGDAVDEGGEFAALAAGDDGRPLVRDEHRAERVVVEVATVVDRVEDGPRVEGVVEEVVAGLAPLELDPELQVG